MRHLLWAVPLACTVSAAGAQDAGPVQTPTIVFEAPEQGLWAGWTAAMVDFQRQVNAEIAQHMTAVHRGDDLGALMLGIGVAFLYGMIHAFGPGHGKFIVVSYFLGREVRIAQGLAMAVQVALVHVIAAVAIVWLADTLLEAGLGIGLADVPGVRAASFLLIAAIGLWMLYQAIRAALGYIDPSAVGHGHSHSHSHGHGHSHAHAHGHSHTAEGPEAARPEDSRIERRLMALAAGVVPCPGAVLIMLYAVANNMIYPGFVLVGAMSAGIGLTICLLGVGAILARQTAQSMIVRAGGGAGGVALFRHVMNFGGAILVTLIGGLSFVAFLNVPLG